MKIGIVGGTGGIGEGMALRLAPYHEVIIGSRDVEKACSVSEGTVACLSEHGLTGRCIGLCNQEAVDEGDIVRLLPESAQVVAAFNNIAANRWKDQADELDYSVAVCGDDDEAKAEVMQLTNTISKLCAFDAGPLRMASIVESITPLLLNLARFNKMKDVGVRFV